MEDAKGAVEAGGEKVVARRLCEGDCVDGVGVAGEGGGRGERGALGARGGGRLGGGDVEDVAFVVAGAGRDDGGVERVLGYTEDAVLVAVKVGYAVVLEGDFLYGALCIVLAVRVHGHVVAHVYLFARLLGVEHGLLVRLFLVLHEVEIFGL